MNTEFIKGVIVPIITVINEDEKIDEAGMRDQVDYVIEGVLTEFWLMVPMVNSTRLKKMRWNAASGLW